MHDAGELAAAASTLGIGHPAGSPLWTQLAHVFAGLPIAGSPAARMALLSTLAAAATAALTACLLRRWHAPPTPAFAAGLTVILCPPVWSTALGVEVYSLQLASVLALVLVVDRWRHAPHLRSAALVGLVGGLTLSIHHSLAPAVLMIVIGVSAATNTRWRAFASAFGGLVAGLSPYLYLPIRATSAPAMNWGDPSTIERLWAHLSSRQYRLVGLSPPDLGERAGDTIVRLAQWLSWPGLLLALAGLAILIVRRRSTGLTIAVLALTDVSVVIALQSMPLDSEAYLTVTAALMMVCAAVTVVSILRRCHPALLRLTPIVPLAFGFIFWPLVDGTEAVTRWSTARRFAAAPPGAIIWVREDTTAAGAIYHQLVEGWRPDLTLLHPWGLLGATHLPAGLAVSPQRGEAEASRRSIDRSLFLAATASGRDLLHSDRQHHSLDLTLEPHGVLWRLPIVPAPPLASAALLPVLPDQRRWQQLPDPTVRGQVASDAIGLAATLARRRDTDEARAVAEQAVASGLTFASVHSSVGQMWLDLGFDQQAELELHRAARLAPEEPAVWLALGVAQARQGGLDTAVRSWRRALQLRPDWPPALINIGRGELALGHNQQAEQALRRAWALTGDPQVETLLRTIPDPPQRQPAHGPKPD